MKIIFVTDIHGNKTKYRSILDAAKRHRAVAVVNGGDMLPRNDDIHRTQKEFIKNFLDDYFAKYEKNGIYHLGYLGNDDLKINDPYFEKICAKHPHVINLAQRRFALGAFEFIGMNWVVDYPFRLKDRCRKDRKDDVFQRQFGPGLLSTENGFKELEDWPTHAATLATIEEELIALPKPRNPAMAVYVIHMPPAGVGLDVCQSGDKVGSKTVCQFIERTQPLLTLHGHIHESPACSGRWKAEIGRTMCVQPGQLSEDSTSYVMIDLDSMKMEKFEESLARR